VTIFKRQKDNKEIIMIGTAHISEESVKLVRRTIKTVKPDVVMIELDPKRVGKIAGENRTLEEAGFDIPAGSEPLRVLAAEKPKAKPGFVRKALESLSATVGVWIQDAGGKLIGRVLSEFYKSVEKLGFVAGGEFKAAVEEGREIGARILLGDRDVDITLNRLATAVTNSKQENFDRVVSKITALESAAGIELPNDAELSKGTLNSFIESVKQRDLLTQVMGAVKTDLPEVYGALIGERDIFMAEGLATSTGVNIVGVVGMAHMEGIENYLTTNKGFSVVKRNCPPSNPLPVGSKAVAPTEAPVSAQESIYQ
jgi:pheromone shutdown protein TraB